MRAGATELAVLSSWVPGRLKTEQWATLARARAIENICHVVAVTQAAAAEVRATAADMQAAAAEAHGAAAHSAMKGERIRGGEREGAE